VRTDSQDDPHFDPQAINLNLKAVDLDIWRPTIDHASPLDQRWMQTDTSGRRWAAAFWQLRDSLDPGDVDRALVRAWNTTPKHLEEQQIGEKFIAHVYERLGSGAEQILKECRILG